jgi:hypothetical protein
LVLKLGKNRYDKTQALDIPVVANDGAAREGIE